MEALELVAVNKIKYWKAYEEFSSSYKKIIPLIKDKAYAEFDESLGLEYKETTAPHDMMCDDFYLFLKDKSKFLLAKIKYEF